MEGNLNGVLAKCGTRNIIFCLGQAIAPLPVVAPVPEYTEQSDDAFLYGNNNREDNPHGRLGKRELEANTGGGDDLYFVLDSTPQSVVTAAQRQPGGEGKGWVQGQGPKKKRRRTLVSIKLSNCTSSLLQWFEAVISESVTFV